MVAVRTDALPGCVVPRYGSPLSWLMPTAMTGSSVIKAAVIRILVPLLLLYAGTVGFLFHSRGNFCDRSEFVRACRTTVELQSASLDDLRGALGAAKERESAANEKVAEAEARAAAAEETAAKARESAAGNLLEAAAVAEVGAAPDGSSDGPAASGGANARLLSGPMPECAGKGAGRARSWIMVFMGHSGSTAIVSELSQHSEVFWHLPEPVDHGERQENATAAYDYVRDFFQRGIDAGKTPGFKMRPNHILNPAMSAKWASLVEEFDTRIIWQYRENVFKQSVGEYSHRYLNDTSVVEGVAKGVTREERCKVGAGCRFRVDNYGFFHELLRDALNNDMLISKGVHRITGGKPSACALPMPYEAYLYDRARAMARLQDFLGLTHEEHAPDRAKATSDSMCDAVENYGDLCREFYGCHVWRSLMDDATNNCNCAMFATGPGSAQRCGTALH